MEVENLLAPRRKKFKLQFSHAGPKGKKQNVPQGSLLRAGGNLLNGSGGRRNLRLDSLILRYSHRARSNSRALKRHQASHQGAGSHFAADRIRHRRAEKVHAIFFTARLAFCLCKPLHNRRRGPGSEKISRSDLPFCSLHVCVCVCKGARTWNWSKMKAPFLYV